MRHLASVELLMLLLIPLVYIVSWTDYILSASLTLALLIIALLRYHQQADLKFLFLGMILGGIGEYFCVQAGVWIYRKPFLFGIPLWLPPFWGYAFLLMNRWGERLLGPEVRRSDWPLLLRGSYLFFQYLMLIGLTVGFSERNLILFGCLLILGLFNLAHSSRMDRFFALIFPIMGVALELIAVHSKIWYYDNPDFFGLPFWLPLLYLNFAIFIRKTVRFMSDHMTKSSLHWNKGEQQPEGISGG